MTTNQLATLWLGACRYYQGRCSYAVSDFCDLLRQEWSNLPVGVQDLLARDIHTVVINYQEGRGYLGHDCDVYEWVTLDAWIQERYGTTTT